MKKKGEGRNRRTEKMESVVKAKKIVGAKAIGKIGDNSKREEIFQKAGAYSAVFFMAFFVALVSASAFTPADRSNAATDLNINYSNTGYSINIASFGTDAQTPGEVRMSLTGAPDTGSVAIEYDKLQVQTNSSGYKVYIGMKDSSQKLVNYTSTASGEYCEQAEATTGCYFNAVSGSTQTPVKLEMNTWGFAVPKDANAPSKVAGYGFDPAYITSSKKISDGMSNIKPTESSIDLNNKFAAVPAAGSEAMIAGGTNTSGQEATSNYYVFYGIKANTTLAAGEYKGTVVYTALAEASPSTGEVSVAPEYQKTLDGSGSGEGRITVETKIYGSSELVNKLIQDGSATVTVGGETCSNVTVIGPTIDEGSMGPISIACDTPTMKRYGTYDVVATVGDYGTYTKNNGYSYYIPWADMESNPGKYTMQQFTAKACNEVAVPAAYTGTIAGGDYQAVTNVPEVSLKDARNTNHVYRVRKLADGNCWMADNLRLTLDDSVALTSLDSDINYNMDTGIGWDGTTTPVRVISNDLQGTVNPLGVYNTDSSTGVISWTPFADTQKGTGDAGDNQYIRYGFGISWGSPYVDAQGTRATSGYEIPKAYRHFGLNGVDVETESANYFVNNNVYAEYARSYSNEASGQTGTGTDVGNIKMDDGDGQAQYYGNYYNAYAASAGSLTYVMINKDGVNSVCPVNWELPRDDGDRSWYNLLYTKYGMTVLGNSGSEAIIAEVAATMKAPFSIISAG
ncbi:MAG: hypothetical protein Q4F60_01470, partial [Candidatus Saccharibacteria bacterium]|nr:hypothetical protein [Candidatus Saccharibacteria bacterium]